MPTLSEAESKRLLSVHGVPIAPELVVANAWHSTNKEFAWSMGLDVTQALRHVADQLGGAAASRSRAWRPAMADVPQLMTAALA